LPPYVVSKKSFLMMLALQRNVQKGNIYVQQKVRPLNSFGVTLSLSVVNR